MSSFNTPDHILPHQNHFQPTSFSTKIDVNDVFIMNLIEINSAEFEFTGKMVQNTTKNSPIVKYFQNY
jgi:hypothetical protein